MREQPAFNHFRDYEQMREPEPARLLVANATRRSQVLGIRVRTASALAASMECTFPRRRVARFPRRLRSSPSSFNVFKPENLGTKRGFDIPARDMAV